jgi:hypothetical protein
VRWRWISRLRSPLTSSSSKWATFLARVDPKSADGLGCLFLGQRVARASAAARVLFQQPLLDETLNIAERRVV